MLNVKASAVEEAGIPAQRPYALVRSYNRDVGRSITIGSSLMYSGFLVGAGLLFCGVGPASLLAAAAGLGAGYYFGHRRVQKIDEQFRSRGLPAHCSVVDR